MAEKDNAKTKILRIPAVLIAEAYCAGQHMVDAEGLQFAAVEVVETVGRGDAPNTVGMQIIAAVGVDGDGVENRIGRSRCVSAKPRAVA